MDKRREAREEERDNRGRSPERERFLRGRNQSLEQRNNVRQRLRLDDTLRNSRERFGGQDTLCNSGERIGGRELLRDSRERFTGRDVVRTAFRDRSRERPRYPRDREIEVREDKRLANYRVPRRRSPSSRLRRSPSAPVRVIRDERERNTVGRVYRHRRSRSRPLEEVGTHDVQERAAATILTSQKDFEKRVEEEVARRVEAEVQRRVDQLINSTEFRKEIETRLQQERERHERTLKEEIEQEKLRILEEFKRKEEEAKRSKQKLDDILAENERRIREEQQRLAEEQAKADALRLLELQKLQLAREEERRKKALEEQVEGVRPDEGQLRQKLVFKMKGNAAALF